MPGYATETRTVQVTAGARTPLDVRMNAVKGFVTEATNLRVPKFVSMAKIREKLPRLNFSSSRERRIVVLK